MGPDSELEFYLPLGCLSLLDSFPSMWVSILTLQSLDRNSSYLAGFFFFFPWFYDKVQSVV